jgi:hypothetical protein
MMKLKRYKRIASIEGRVNKLSGNEFYIDDLSRNKKFSFQNEL